MEQWWIPIGTVCSGNDVWDIRYLMKCPALTSNLQHSAVNEEMSIPGWVNHPRESDIFGKFRGEEGFHRLIQEIVVHFGCDL